MRLKDHAAKCVPAQPQGSAAMLIDLLAEWPSLNGLKLFC
jgi:hypothetical protein